MAIRAWLIDRWAQSTQDGAPYFAASSLAPGVALEDVAGTGAANIPPGINVGVWRRDGIPDKATLDALDALPGAIVLCAVNGGGAAVAGYLRPQDTPTGAQLNAAKTRLQAAGIPTGTLSGIVTLGMTCAQIADALRAYARDLLKG